MKRLAIIITNSSSSRSAIAAHVRWKWVDVSGKPGELMQQHNGLLNNAGFVVNARARVLILPDGTATQAGQRMRGVASSLRVPPALMTALNVTVALDAIILADGEVIGPDQGGLVQELQGRAEAGAKVKDIIEAAQAQGRDPRLDIAKAAADPTLSSATRRYMVDLAHGGGRSGSLPVPRQIQLPNFYRK